MLNKQDEIELNVLCDKYGSDKGSMNTESPYYSQKPHNYTKIYAALFSGLKDKELKIFECGLGTNNPSIKSSMGVNGMPGASLRVWKDYFKNSMIFGADIDKNILFQEDRITTEYMDQTNSKSVKAFWNKVNTNVDIIIDDGLHEYHAGVSLYENSIDRLNPGGIYVIEDILPEDVNKYKAYFTNNKNTVMVLSLDRSTTIWNDNTLVIIIKN